MSNIPLEKLMNLEDGKVLYDDLRERIDDKYEKPDNGIPLSDLASGVVTSVIDDTAGDGDTAKVFSADKVTDDLAGKQNKINVSGILKGNGSGGVSAAVEGTDYINGNLIAVQDSTPTDPNAQIWFPETQPSSVQVPTYSELTQLSSALNDVITQKVDKTSLDNAGILSKSYTIIMDETVLTVSDETHISPYSLAAATYNFNKNYMYRVTFDGTEYVLPCQLWWEAKNDDVIKVYEYIGNLSLYTSTNGITHDLFDVPFVLINDVKSAGSIEVLTSTAGTHTIKLEVINNTQIRLPNSLIYGKDYYPIEHISNDSSTYDSVSVGVNTITNKRANVAIGFGNTISNEGSVAIGTHNVVTGAKAYAIGSGCTSSGVVSMAQGLNSIAEGNRAHAEGNCTEALGNNSHAEGNHTIADGINAHSEGAFTQAIGSFSHTQGNRTIAKYSVQHAMGKYNVPDPYEGEAWDDGTYAEIVGNGTDENARSNARTLDWQGNERLKGNVYVECNSDSSGGTMLPKDVQVNGTSVVQNGVANVPMASSSALGVIKVNGSGLYLDGNGVINTYKASSANIKEGTNGYKPIVSQNQHESVFYGLAKLAGADMASSSNLIGTYTDEAKVAIQKMLGIYEAPWELIREDTVTNATETDVEIIVDGNGQAFELTDVYMQVWMPQQETQASIGDYGTVRFYYNNSNYITSQMGTWTQAASASERFGQVLLTNENGAIKNTVTNNATKYSAVNLVGRTNVIDNDALMKIGTFTFTKSVIKKVTGTLKYKLYGRRKWN